MSNSLAVTPLCDNGGMNYNIITTDGTRKLAADLVKDNGHESRWVDFFRHAGGGDYELILRLRAHDVFSIEEDRT
jgi:hypothetical protein